VSGEAEPGGAARPSAAAGHDGVAAGHDGAAAGHDGVARRGGRRELVLAVVACTAGAALALFAASRTWTVVEQVRPAPLPPLREAHIGAALAPWLPALALVALAGAGALVATRRTGRTLVGVLLVACGLGIVLAAVHGLRDGASAGWPVLCAAGGVVVAGTGLVAARRGRRWPVMGSRYERPAAPASDSAPTSTEMWDAIDRGNDPTG
jgi:drug/metabolite transporter (DMT)-like permease